MPVTTIDTANIEATAMNVSIARMQSFWVVVLYGVRMLVFMLRLYKARILHRAVRFKLIELLCSPRYRSL
jgi:hypothetical protein